MNNSAPPICDHTTSQPTVYCNERGTIKQYEIPGTDVSKILHIDVMGAMDKTRSMLKCDKCGQYYQPDFWRKT